jgi:hypothetical protein
LPAKIEGPPSNCSRDIPFVAVQGGPDRFVSKQRKAGVAYVQIIRGNILLDLGPKRSQGRDDRHHPSESAKRKVDSKVRSYIATRLIRFIAISV